MAERLSLGSITPGMVLEARTAQGDWIRMRATGWPAPGRSFPVVWVCTEGDYAEAQATGEELRGIPWPLEDVRKVDTDG